MKPHLKRNGDEPKTGDELVLSLLEGDRLDSVLEAVQSRVAEARRKCEEIKNAANAEAVTINENAKKQAANMIAKANEKVTEIRAQATQEARAIQIARTELRDAESTLASERRLFDARVAAIDSDMMAFVKKWGA